jgi:type II secretory pathway pseudopilin PulG
VTRAGVPCRERPSRRALDESGYTLLEMVVSVGIMVIITGSIFQMAGSSQSMFRVQPETSDMQQRLRIAADSIASDLLMAGAGPYQAPTVGALGNYFPAIRPARRGIQSPDGGLTFAADRISIVYVPTTRAQTVTNVAMASAGADVQVAPAEPGCAAGGNCGFVTGTSALIFDGTGVGLGYELFNVTGASAGVLKHSSPNLAFTKAYPVGSRVVEVEQHVYYRDAATSRLMHYDGSQTDSALVDNVSSLSFSYYADPDPNSAPKPPTGGSNCVYDAGTPPVPLLKNLGGTALVKLLPADLTDGPTCGIAPNQFDGDLLRVRKIRVSIGVKAGGSNLRPAPRDYAVSFEVAPRNMNLIR